MNHLEDSPTSLWMISAASELYPKEKTQKEDANLQIPFNELPGESVKYIGKCENGELAISNYRLFLSNTSKSFETSIPLRVIETVAIKEIFQLVISCKDSVTYVCSFLTSDSCSEWHVRISIATGVPDQLENFFAFPFHAWVSESTTSLDQEWFNRLQHSTDFDENFQRELERLQYDLKGAWRVTSMNSEFKLCPSYPKHLIVPACICDETLVSVAGFRSSKRIPVVTWRHSSGAIISRSSQPEVGWLGWRNNKDEQHLKAFCDACSFDNGDPSPKTDTNLSDTSTENVEIDKPKKLLIVDARSYASAITNRARGGGVECPEYYTSAEIQFMNLGNIHVVRKSFHSLRTLCAFDMDLPNWYSLLEKTGWLHHISGLLSATTVVIHAIEKSNRPVLVHCSDGWDRTPQIVATAKLCLDPFYRTIEGFRILVETEWLSYGHKFGDRCGHNVGIDDVNERCPVFLQWIDCVHQICRQFPCSFEFSTGYLIKLAQHVHSCLFGTFLCNTLKERLDNSIPERTFSVWPFLSAPIYRNPLYQQSREKVIWPSHQARKLVFWNDFYIENGLIKTRSFDDLMAEVKCKGSVRRVSDPSIVFGENNMQNLNVSIFQDDIASTSSAAVAVAAASNGDITSNHKSNENNNKIKCNGIHKNDVTLTNSKYEINGGGDSILNVNNRNNASEDVMKISEKSESTIKEMNGNGHDPSCDDLCKDEVDSPSSKQLTESDMKLNELNIKTCQTIPTIPVTVDNLEQHLRRTKIFNNSINNNFVNGFKNGSDTAKKESSSSNDSQVSTPALRSTTPALLDRQLVLPDGLNHALSQENLRLQQLVYEHKLKEETLQNELYIMRLALLKSTSCQCNNNQNNKSNSANMSEDAHPECTSENSICSWEAVDDNRGPTITPWIPDGARSKCKNCQVEFWLGRRRHHCRKCLEIFCADCSDNFAQLPNEFYQSPVRLCESCFKSITVEKEN